MSGALDGMCILELTPVRIGPFASQQLGDMGADLIEIEPPSGDTRRHWGATRPPGMASGFQHGNRNTPSVSRVGSAAKSPGQGEGPA